jgi:ribose transport system substrate-binding protein
MGYYGTKLLDDLFHHPPTPLAQNWAHSQVAPLPSFVDTGSFTVDKSNLAAFQQQSKAAGQ